MSIRDDVQKWVKASHGVVKKVMDNYKKNKNKKWK